MISNQIQIQIQIQITKQIKIVNDNVAHLLAKKTFQSNPTPIENDTSSIQMDIETYFIELSNNTTRTPTKGGFCNKEAMPKLVKKDISEKSKLEVAETKLEKLQK